MPDDGQAICDAQVKTAVTNSRGHSPVLAWWRRQRTRQQHAHRHRHHFADIYLRFHCRLIYKGGIAMATLHSPLLPLCCVQKCFKLTHFLTCPGRVQDMAWTRPDVLDRHIILRFTDRTRTGIRIRGHVIDISQIIKSDIDNNSQPESLPMHDNQLQLIRR